MRELYSSEKMVVSGAGIIQSFCVPPGGKPGDGLVMRPWPEGYVPPRPVICWRDGLVPGSRRG